MEGGARVVIVGGGFGGLYAAVALADRPFQVTLLDRRNYHLFQPFLYQVATAGLSPGDIAQPIRHILAGQPNATVLLAEAKAVDLKAKTLQTDIGPVEYDYLILAAGASSSYFGKDRWKPFAPGLKDIDDALEIRRRILLAFEKAEREQDPAKREALLTFVVVGGGPTGVELAGAVAEIARHALAGEYRDIDPSQAKVMLIEAGARILPAFDERLSGQATALLREKHVDVLTSCAVTDVREGAIEAGGMLVAAETVIWAAGVQGPPIAKTLNVPLDRAGRVLVQPDLTLPGHPEVYAIGDMAALVQDGKPVPGLAPAAIQMGRHAAANIVRTDFGKPREAFRYRDKGSMATIGRNAAIAQIGPIKTAGFFAWLLWLFVHILFLIGFRSRALVLLEWAWAYLTYDRGVRLITRE